MDNSKIKSIRDWLWTCRWWCITGIALLVLTVVGWRHWDSIECIWLDFGENSGERLRNVALVFLATVGLFMAHWRNRTLDKQAETSERGLNNDRYQKGTEMLGSEVLAVRMGGVLALERLAREQAKNYHIQIMDLLCAFIRHPFENAPHPASSSVTSKGEKLRRCGRDVELAVKVIGRRIEGQRKIERENKWKADLRCANLHCANLGGTNLQGTNLQGANLSNAVLILTNLTDANLILTNLIDANLIGTNLCRADLGGADLTQKTTPKQGSVTMNGANLMEANLTEANLSQALLSGAVLNSVNLTDANLYRANLSDAILTGVRGLTQKQLNTAKASKNAVPDLSRADCAETGEPLVWGGKTIED